MVAEKNTPPVRALFCHYTADIVGGSDRSLLDLVTHLPRERFNPVMVLKTGDPLAVKYRNTGITTYEITLVSPRRSLEIFKLLRFVIYFLPSVLNIARIIRKEKIQVVHVNTLFNLQGALAARITNRPLVWHIRELLPDSKVVRLFLGCVRRWATRVIPNSHAVAVSVAACGDRVHVIHNGIDLQEYENLPDGTAVRIELNAPADAPVITVLGRIEPWKGQHVAVEAFPQVLKNNPTAQLWIVGGAAVNKPEYLAGIQQRVAALGIAEHVLFTGIRHDIPAVLAASNVLVLPSVTPEPFGRTIVEAMAARCPVIATNQGGPLEIVREGVTGYFVPPEDAIALADAINKMLENPEQATRLGEKGCEIACKYFSLERVVEQVGAVLLDATDSQ